MTGMTTNCNGRCLPNYRLLIPPRQVFVSCLTGRSLAVSSDVSRVRVYTECVRTNLTFAETWWSTLAAYQAANNVQVVYIVYKCVHGAASSYLCILVAASTGRRLLSSASHGDLMVPWAKTDLLPGMICHRLYVHCRLHWDSSRINWRQTRQYYFVHSTRHDQALSWLFRL